MAANKKFYGGPKYELDVDSSSSSSSSTSGNISSSSGKRTEANEHRMYFRRLQAQLAAEATKVREATVAAARRLPESDEFSMVLQLLKRVKTVYNGVMDDLEIASKYCKLDSTNVFRHGQYCQCKIGILDPSESSRFVPDHTLLGADGIAQLFQAIPQGHSLWKSLHMLLDTGTSSHFSAGFSTRYKHWILEYAIQLGVLIEHRNQKQMINMIGGKFFEEPLRRCYEHHLQRAESNPSIRIIDTGGILLPRTPELRFIGHSNDGIIAGLNQLFELKVQNWIGRTPKEIEANYMTQVQIGMLITETRSTRLLCCQRPKEQRLPLPDIIWGNEYIVHLDESYLTTIIRRIAYVRTCQHLNLIPSEQTLRNLGELPTPQVHSIRRIKLQDCARLSQ